MLFQYQVLEDAILSTRSADLVEAASFLDELSLLAMRAGRDLISRDAASLADRLRQSAFYVACVGQFKRGKSTVLDALLGEAILPVGVLPITAVPTVVRHGPSRAARVRLKGGGWTAIGIDQIESYISEAENPGNARGVDAVEISLPSDLLDHGLCLVDTPGLGSVFELNTAATHHFVPHVDAAIVVLGADPPISRDELDLVARLSHVDDLIFVLNKADRLPAADVAEATAFAADILSRRLRRAVTILEIAAKEQLELRNDARDWPALIGAVTQLAHSSRERLVTAAGQRGAVRLAKSLADALSEDYEALTGPVEVMALRQRRVDELVSRADAILLDLSTLMSAEQRRAVQSTEVRRQTWLQAVEVEARSDLTDRIPAETVSGPVFRRSLLEQAQEISQRHVRGWLSTEEVKIELDYRRLRERFIAIAIELLGRLAESGVGGMDRAIGALEAGPDLSSRTRFQFLDAMRVARPASPFRYMADAFLGFTGRTDSIRRDAEAFLAYLLDTNTSRVQRDLDDRLSATRNDLERLLRRTLTESIDGARAALESLAATRREGEEAVASETARLKSSEQQLMRLARTHGFDPALANLPSGPQ